MNDIIEKARQTMRSIGAEPAEPLLLGDLANADYDGSALFGVAVRHETDPGDWFVPERLLRQYAGLCLPIDEIAERAKSSRYWARRLRWLFRPEKT